MPAPKGHAKWGGRKKGTPNKINSEVAELIKASGKDPFQTMIDLLDHQEAHIRLSAAKELAQYVKPKRKAIEHSGPEGQPIAIEAMPVTNEDRKALLEDAKGDK
jgi:hypothetical protein